MVNLSLGKLNQVQTDMISLMYGSVLFVCVCAGERCIEMCNRLQEYYQYEQYDYFKLSKTLVRIRCSCCMCVLLEYVRHVVQFCDQAVVKWLWIVMTEVFAWCVWHV